MIETFGNLSFGVDRRDIDGYNNHIIHWNTEELKMLKVKYAKELIYRG